MTKWKLNTSVSDSKKAGFFATMKSPNRLVLAMAVLLASYGVQAADRFWDGGSVNIGTDGNGASAGGAGTWNTTLLNWDAGVAPHVAWTNANNDTAVFGGSGATVTLGTGISVGGMTLTSAYTITGNTLTFGTAGPISNTANVTISSILAGSSPITKDGSGTLNLNLSGTNTFSGGMVLNGGIVTFKEDYHLGDPDGTLTFNGAMLNFTPSKTTYSTRPLVLNPAANVIKLQGNAHWYIGGPVTGTGGVKFQGNPNGGVSAHLTHLGNTFTGELGLDPNGVGLLVELASLLDGVDYGNIYFMPNASPSTLTWRSDATNALLLANRQIEFRGDGNATAIFINANTSHGITVNTDLVVPGTGAKSLTLSASSTVPVNVFAGDITDGTGGATVTLVKTGNGTWQLTGNNTYSGNTTISAGTLVFDTVNPMTNHASLYLPSATSKNITLNSDLNVDRLYVGGVEYPVGTYSSSGAGSAWMNTGSGVLTVGAAEIQPVWWDSDGNTAGAGGATPTGTWGVDAYWSLSSAGDAATAAWTTGRTAAFAAGSDATGSYTVTVSGSQDIGGLAFEEGTVTLAGGTALRLVNDASVYVAAGLTATVETVISEDATARNLASTGSGTLILTGANTYSGATTVNGGTLTIANATAISSNLVVQGGNVTFSTDASMETLVFNSSLKRTVTGPGTLTFTPGGSITVNSAMTGNWGVTAALSLPISNSPSVTLNTGGNVETVFAPTAGTISLGTISGAGLIHLGGSTTGNSIAGAGSNKIRVTGGEWTLLGNAFAYEHFIDSGMLIVEGELRSLNRNLTVASNATLVVNGTVYVTPTTTYGLVFSGNTQGTNVPAGGTLKGTGVVKQTIPLDLRAEATLAPGYPTGALTITNCDCTINGKLAITVNGSQVSTLAMDPAKILTISSATLEVNITASTALPMTIVTYGVGKLTGTFASHNLPNGWTIDYEANSGTAIVLTPPAAGTLIQLL